MYNKLKGEVLKDLTRWNYFACVLHFCAFLFAVFYIDSEKAKAKVYKFAFDDSTTNISRVDFPVKLADAGLTNLKFYTASFFAVTAISHFLYATDFFGRKYYSAALLGTGWNPWRWFEYSISASIMIYIICIVTGTKETVEALSTALITPSLMLQGYSVEGLLHQNELHDWSIGHRPSKPKIESAVMWFNFLPAWFLYLIHWYIIVSNYQRISKEAADANKPVDSSVIFMVYSQLILFSFFGFIQTYQVYRWTTAHKGREEWSYVTYEKAYIILSSTTKLLLAGTVLYALR